MQTLTLQQLFGESANQTATELVIKKSDLVAVGLTPQTSNRAEQLVTAIILYALRNFQGRLTDESNNIVTDENNYPIIYDNTSLWELLEILHWGIYIPDGYTDRIRNQIIIHSYVQAD